MINGDGSLWYLNTRHGRMGAVIASRTWVALEEEVGEERGGGEGGGGGMKTGLKQDWWLLMPLVGFGVGRLEGGGVVMA